MKVLVVMDALDGENYGTVFDCMNIIRYLHSSGDDVRLLSPNVEKNSGNLVNYYLVKKIDSADSIDPISKLNSAILNNANNKFLKEIINDADVVHIMMPFGLGYKVAKIAKKLGVPITTSFHAQAESVTSQYKLMNVRFANNTIYKYYFKHLYSLANAVQYPTEFTKMIFEGSVKRRTNSYIISSGVDDVYQRRDVQRDSTYSKHFNILFIGRFAKEKNHEALIKAVAKSKHKDNIQLVFAGQGSYKEEIVKLAKDLGVIPPITLFVSRESLVDIINSCDLYVHPADAENEGISCLEAISCGLVPIICDSKKSAIKSVALSEKNLFREHSIEDLTDKIDYWIEHPKEKKECSEQYLGFTKSYSREICLEKVRKMILTYSDPINRNKLVKYYYSDELNDDFAFSKIEVKKSKKPFKYIHKNPIWRFFEFIIYNIIARPLVYLINQGFFHQRIKNKALLKRCKHTGYFVYSNHTHGMADAFTPNILSPKRNYIVVGREAVSIKGLKGIVTMLGAIPLYTSIDEVGPFNECIKTRVNAKKRAITIYPEAHIWPYYTKIRPFRKDSFRFPVDNKKPVYVLTHTWQKRKLSKRPRLISYLSGPLFPNEELSRVEAMEDLRERVYHEMLRVSNSIEQVEKIKYIKVEK